VEAAVRLHRSITGAAIDLKGGERSFAAFATHLANCEENCPLGRAIN
jgi:hypothetical protein